MIGNSSAILHAKTQLPLGFEHGNLAVALPVPEPNSTNSETPLKSSAQLINPEKQKLPQEAANDSENLIKDMSLPEEEPKPTASNISDKLLPAVTYSNAALNVVSILASSLSLKTGQGKEKAQSMEKFGLLATKAQAIAAGIGFMEKAFKTKNIVLLATAFAQAFKVFPDYDRLMRFSAIPSAGDQLPAGLNPLTGTAEYESFSHSWRENKKAFMNTWKEFTSDPKSFMNLLKPSAPSGHTKVLAPLSVFVIIGGILSNIVDSPVFGPLRMPLLAITAGIRHGAGAISDYVLSKDDDNPNNKKAGLIYLVGSALDYAGLFVKKEIGHLMHQAACLLNPIAEMSLMQGAGKQVKPKALAA